MTPPVRPLVCRSVGWSVVCHNISMPLAEHLLKQKADGIPITYMYIHFCFFFIITPVVFPIYTSTSYIHTLFLYNFHFFYITAPNY